MSHHGDRIGVSMGVRTGVKLGVGMGVGLIPGPDQHPPVYSMRGVMGGGQTERRSTLTVRASLYYLAPAEKTMCRILDRKTLDKMTIDKIS